MAEFNLRHNISETVAQADLEYYAGHTAPSPDMTHAIHTVVALDRAALSTNTKWRKLADQEFLNTYQKFCFPPFYMFSENAGNGGDVLYLTSGAGFLQSLVYGYGAQLVVVARVFECSLWAPLYIADYTVMSPGVCVHTGGVRVLPDGLQLRPVLPPNSTRFALKGIQFLGSVLSLSVEGKIMRVTARAGDGSASLMLHDASSKASPMQGGLWSGPLQRVVLRVK